MEKIRQFSGIHILQTTRPFSFKFGRRIAYVHGERKIYEFGKNRHSGFIEIQGVKYGELEVPVNSIRTYSSHGFLGADTQLCVLMLMIQYLCLLCHYDIYLFTFCYLSDVNQ